VSTFAHLSAFAFDIKVSTLAIFFGGGMLRMIGAGIVGLFALGAASAADVQVEVRNNQFVPEVVTINRGDRVIWTNRGSSHNVAANDGAFRSGAPATGAWTFSQTFNAASPEILYKSEAVAGMTGAVVVNDAASYIVGPAVAGAWFTEGFLGQGFTVEYVPSGKQIFATWFTYSAAKEPMWAAGSAALVGNSATISMGTFSNGTFAQPGSPPASPFATVKLTFFNCNSARADWTRVSPVSNGSLPLKRLIPLEKCF